jgi:hypothetical protein
MQDFDVTYWFDTRSTSSARGSTGASVTERRDDSTREEVIAYVEANLARVSFLIDLGGEEGCASLALVRSEAVRYVHIEAVGAPDPRPAFKVDLADVAVATADSGSIVA